MKMAEKNCIPDPHKTRENIISHFVTRHSGGEPRERFDAENYSFIYLSCYTRPLVHSKWESQNHLSNIYIHASMIILAPIPLKTLQV